MVMGDLEQIPHLPPKLRVGVVWGRWGKKGADNETMRGGGSTLSRFRLDLDLEGVNLPPTPLQGTTDGLLLGSENPTNRLESLDEDSLHIPTTQRISP